MPLRKTPAKNGDTALKTHLCTSKDLPLHLMTASAKSLSSHNVLDNFLSGSSHGKVSLPRLQGAVVMARRKVDFAMLMHGSYSPGSTLNLHLKRGSLFREKYKTQLS